MQVSNQRMGNDSGRQVIRGGIQPGGFNIKNIEEVQPVTDEGGEKEMTFRRRSDDETTPETKNEPEERRINVKAQEASSGLNL